MKQIKRKPNTPNPFEYNPNYLDNMEILSKKEKEYLSGLNKMDIDSFLNNKTLVDKIGFDFIYSSSQIEGNTYTKAQTQTLIQNGITAGGKRYSDAKMILNLQKAYNEILSSQQDIAKSTLLNLHFIISEDLVQRANQGNMRNKNIDGITGTNYIPLSPGDRLDGELKYLFTQYAKIKNPFERAIYLHNNLCYLQYFEDCNKRTARAMQLLSLKNDGIIPMVIISDNREKYTEYRDAVVSYYDTGSFEAYKNFFIASYEEQDMFISKIIQNAQDINK